MKFLVWILLLGFTNSAFSQAIYSGKITSTNAHPVPGATIILVKKNNLSILAYAISDNDGVYRITSKELSDSVVMKVSAIGFAEAIKLLPGKSENINFILIEKVTELPNVKVKSNPISVQGDTISYTVGAFATGQDRFIGDIIAKLPGIEIDQNGAIKFNGKPISNYYINGLDLLESRYSIANNNIPYDLVNKVQVMDNHQPLRVLDSLRESTDPALNIELKEKGMNRFIGTAKLGVGVSPLLSDDALTGMQFNRGFQFISAYKYNNTGIRLANELMQQISIRDINEPDLENTKENVLTLVSLPRPLLQEGRYLFNKNHLFHLSALKSLKNTSQLKFNIGYVNDYNRSTGSNAITLFLPSDTIKFIENLKTGISTNNINGDFYYTLNKRDRYVKNAAKFQLYFNNEKGSIQNSGNIYQSLNNPYYQITNDFLLLTPIKKKLFSFNSSTIFNKTPQELSVIPGQFPEFINHSLPYERMIQRATLTKFSSNNSLSFITNIGRLKQDVKIGGQYINKQIESSLSKVKDQTIYPLNDSFHNNLNWQNIKLYGNAHSSFKIDKKQISFSLPVELNNVSVNNKIDAVPRNKSYLFFNPNAAFTFPLGHFFTTAINYNHRHSLGNFIQSTPGIMLTNYRTLNQNDTLLPVQRSDNLSLSNSYKNPLKGLFGNVSLSYSNIRNNIMYIKTYNNIYLKRTAILFPNSAKSLILSGRIDKYFFKSKTNIAFSANYMWNKYLQVLQNDFVKVFTRGTTFNITINYDGSDLMSVRNNSTFNIFSNKIESFAKNKSIFSTVQFQESLQLSFFLSKKMTLFVNADYYYFDGKQSRASNYFFGDVGIKRSFQKIDLELGVNNIINNKYFRMQSMSDNYQSITEMQIRSCSLMLKGYFKF